MQTGGPAAQGNGDRQAFGAALDRFLAAAQAEGPPDGPSRIGRAQPSSMPSSSIWMVGW